MNLDSLPALPLTELSGGPDTYLLCASARLAAELRRSHGEWQRTQGRPAWQAVHGGTPAQWLDHLSSAALLRGELPPAGVPGAFLTWPQERALWQQALAADEQAGDELFDREALAQAAMEAHALARDWRLPADGTGGIGGGDEGRAFLRWQESFTDACRRGGWRTAGEALHWRIDCLARGLSGLPPRVALAGFLAPDPVLARLLAVLAGRGVALFRLDAGHLRPDPAPHVVAATDAAAECRAAAAWAAAALRRAPQAQLVIAVADLAARRRVLADALDAALHPARLGAGWAASEPDWVFADGEPLAEEGAVALALRLLTLLIHGRRARLAEVGALLCAAGWSADIAEADGRARLDARLRERLPPECALERVERAIGRLAPACGTPRLAAALTAALERQRAAPRRQTPADWGRHFTALLQALGWPGERALVAREAAACAALRQTLAGLAALNPVAGRLGAADALRLLRRQAQDTRFAPPRRQPPRLRVSRLDEALGGPCDGLWLMGLNEGVWPPLPRPNPLLPADLQRRAGVPAARADLLAAHAAALQQEVLGRAAQVRLSWACGEGERALRPSPLLAGLVTTGDAMPAAAPLTAPVVPLQLLADASAPPVPDGERVGGGTALLQAQAVCPAWGYYRFRLAAKALETPQVGLDARLRGRLLHAALEDFWRGRDQAALLAFDDAARAAAIAAAVAAAFRNVFAPDTPPPGGVPEALPPRLAALERQRLEQLLAAWLALEATRAPFAVEACEAELKLEIEGLPVRMVIDRIDRLEDGRLLVIDYKTGRGASADSWAQERPSEPQLPIYAALALPALAAAGGGSAASGEVAAVALARVLADKPAFDGVAAESGLLPGVAALDEQRKRYDAAEFPDWSALHARWAERIRALAGEVRDGRAEVRVAQEKALKYCEVKPLLRLAERRRLWEMAGAAAPAAAAAALDPDGESA